MKNRKGAAEATALVWRISDLSPLGEWVDKRVRVAPKAAGVAPSDSHASWMTSTHDLLDGAEVSESVGCDFDELFSGPSKALTLPPEK